jgi:hypothetical protein
VGALPLTHGLAPGGFFKITPNAQFTSSRDVRGNVCRSRTNNFIVPWELKLMNWSEHNTQLSVLHAADTLDSKGAGVGALSAIDPHGATSWVSAACWITTAPADWGFGEEAFEVTWAGECILPPAFAIFGGN